MQRSLTRPALVTRRNAWRLLQIAFMLVAALLAAYALRGQWNNVRAALRAVTPRWWLIAASGIPVVVAYTIQIATWRMLLNAWGAHLAFSDATRIWFVSSLGKYVPGKVWQIGSMTLMSQRRGVSPQAAIGTALIGTITTTISGLAVTAIGGARILALSRLTVWLLLALVTGLLLLPVAFPHLMALAARITRRTIMSPPIGARAIWLAFAASAVVWLLLGLGFQMLASALLGSAPGGTTLYISVFTGSYLAGFLTLIAPGGAIVREGVMASALARAGFDAGSALVLVLASRAWLTVLELGPALGYLVANAATLRREQSDNA